MNDARNESSGFCFYCRFASSAFPSGSDVSSLISTLTGSCSTILKDKNGILKIDRSDLERSQNIKSNDTFGVIESEIANDHIPTERTRAIFPTRFS
jgi:hypothetical protein